MIMKLSVNRYYKNSTFLVYYYYYFAVHLPAVKPKRDNEALPVYWHIWNPTSVLGPNSILPLPQAYQSCLPYPLSCLQRLCHSRFNTHR
jgi:hypothetical protein